jgi:UDP-N-acetylglucosamine:LPS N-acetylglucosamine transferase
MPAQKDKFNRIIKTSKPQKAAADAAARLIAKYGKAAVASAVRNFKPAKAVKVTAVRRTGMTPGYPKSNVKPSQSKFTGEKVQGSFRMDPNRKAPYLVNVKKWH